MKTESQNDDFIGFENWNTSDMVTGLLNSQNNAINAIANIIPDLSTAVEQSVTRLKNGGRLVYVGAGTSGRLGILDGSELLPTFGFPSERVIRIIAGGDTALINAVEGAEDSIDNGRDDILSHTITENDVVIGIAASGRTPYTISAIKTAKDMGAYTIGIANNQGAELLSCGNIGLFLDTGAEPLAGSTRLVAGTSQKIILNIFSTAVMAQLGHVYQGLMVDVLATNIKLKKRSRDMVVKTDWYL